jgi:pilus assembly protein CpaF
MVAVDPKFAASVSSTGGGVTGDLLEFVRQFDEIADLDPAERRLALRSIVVRCAGEENPGPMIAELANSIDGYGPLSHVMADSSVTDVLINGPREVWVERNGRLDRTAIGWPDGRSLIEFVTRLLGLSGARIDASQPFADARMSDGSRVHAVLPPIAPQGPLVSIRKWPTERFTLAELMQRSMFDDETKDLLLDAVVRRRTVVVGGATATGKTTLVNALLGEVPRHERVVLVEETPELSPVCAHFVSLVARPPNIEGRGEVDMLALVRTALRMRPDRIVVGEVRGGEAMAALGAMSTGHAGSMLTVHASSAADAIDRLVTLALQARSGDTEDGIRRMTERAVDLIVHIERRGGRRRIAEVIEMR